MGFDLGSALGFGGLGTMGLGTGLALGGSLISADAAKKAAKTQADSANRSADMQMAQFQQTREDYAPWLSAGTSALGQLQSGMPELTRRFSMADFEVDPGYFFRQSEGEKALARSAAARGMLTSPASLQALLRYNQDLASGEFGNAFNRFNLGQTNEYNRLAGLAGTGQTATAQLGQLGQQNANSIGNFLTSAGAAQAAGTVGAANAITGGIGQGLNFYNQQALLNALGGGGGSNASPSFPSMPMGDYPSLEAALA
jgi:hypothetical protein